MSFATEFDVLRTAAAGMDAQRAALDVAARNVAAAETTDGRSFARLIPRFAFASPADPDAPFEEPRDPEPDPAEAISAFSDHAEPAVRFLGAVPERASHPDAVTEMVAVLDAERAYDANASVFDLGKRLAERTIDVERL